MSVLEAYRSFKGENPEAVIGKSKFAELQHPNVLWCSDTPRNVCHYHKYTKLLLDCVRHHVPRKAFHSKSEFIEALVCCAESPQCMLNTLDCSNAKQLDMHILKNIPEEDKQTQTTWYAFESEGVQVKFQRNGVLGVFLSLQAQSSWGTVVKRNQSASFG